MTEAADLIRRFVADRDLAHRVLFAHRHAQASPAFHTELRRDFWSSEPETVVLAFRGAAKTTNDEESVVLAAVEGRFRNCVWIGSNEARAAESVMSIARELERNDLINGLYGEQAGPVWTQTKIVLTNGCCIQALGRDQDLRGLKHYDWRPDLVIAHDFEDKETVQTPDGRAKTFRWLLSEVLPMCDPAYRIRVRATPMDAESVPMRLMRDGWPAKVFPIVYLGEDGEEVAAWPERFPLEWVERRKRIYVRSGEVAVWEREFMCNAEPESERVFRPEHFRVEPRARLWQATYSMTDPARTASRKTSATTGWAVWSWVGRKLVVWDGGAEHWLPDEIVAKQFEIAAEHDPVWVGIEENGLEEWLRQPLRAEFPRRGAIPLRGVRAPRGKLDFIRGLQPLAAGGDVIFAREMPVMREQFLGFPRGRIDAPNALAYALQLRPGALIYDAFGAENIGGDLAVDQARPLWLALNATKRMVTAVACQVKDGALHVLHDWLVEGDPAEVVDGILLEAGLQGAGLRLVAGPQHFDRWQNVGLVQACNVFPADVQQGAAPDLGRGWIRGVLDSHVRGLSGLRCADDARWTLRAFTGGYCRGVDRRGAILESAEDGEYRVLMEGLESFCALIAHGRAGEDDGDANYAYDRAGRRYLSIMPARGGGRS